MKFRTQICCHFWPDHKSDYNLPWFKVLQIRVDAPEGDQVELTSAIVSLVPTTYVYEQQAFQRLHKLKCSAI